jgi:hypothetical protein
VYAAPVGHGVVVIPLPAWLLLVIDLTSRSTQEVMIPSPWLAPAIPLTAFAAGALRGRRQSRTMT